MLTYVETFRARRVVVWTLGVLFALSAFSYVVSASQTHHWSIHVPPADPSLASGIPTSAIALLGGVIALVGATILGTSLQAQRAAIRLLWTLPVERERIALGTFAVDLVAVAALWASVVVIFGLVPLALIGALPYVYVDGGETLIATASLAAACIMWYGLLQLATAAMPGHGARLAGFSWLFAIVVMSLEGAQPPLTVLRQVADLLRWIDPLQYVTSIRVHAGHAHLDLGLPPALNVAIPLAIGLIALVAATVVWRRLEV